MTSGFKPKQNICKWSSFELKASTINHMVTRGEDLNMKKKSKSEKKKIEKGKEGNLLVKRAVYEIFQSWSKEFIFVSWVIIQLLAGVKIL